MDSFLTIAETADVYGVSEKTVRRWIADSQIIAWRMPGGRLLRIDASSLDGILEPVNYRGYMSRSERKSKIVGVKELPDTDSTKGAK